MKLRIGSAIIMSALMMGLWWFTQRHNSSMEERVREMESGVPAFDKKDFKACVQQSREKWDAAMKAAAGRHLPAAGRAYADVHYSNIKTFAEHYGTEEAEPGLTVKAWQAKKEEEFRALVRKELPAWFDSLAAGDLPLGTLTQFLTTTEQFGFKEPQQQFKEAERRLEIARAKAASRWLRVDISADSPEYAEQLTQALRGKWNERYGFKLTFGYSMGYLEDQATWKTLRIRVEQEEARYEVVSKSHWGSVSPPVVPRSVRVTFTPEESIEVPSTWSRLGALSASVEVPERLSIKENDSIGRAKLQALERDKKKEILAKLEPQLARLPAFELFPGVNPVTLSLRKGERLDMDAARALGYLDKQRLVSQIQELSRDPKFQPDAAALIVGAEIETLAPWLAQTIPQLAPDARRGVIQELKRKPWFGDYEPLVALVRTEGRQSSYTGLDFLRGQLQVTKVREAVVEQAARPTPVRQNFASVYIAEAPLDEVRSQVTTWLADTNVDFVRGVLMQLGNRDSQAAAKVAVAGFSRAPDAMKPALFDQIARRGNRPGEETFALARQAMASRHEPLRESATRFLLDHAYEPAGWDLLQESLKMQPATRRADDIRQKLVLTVRRAHPDSAQEFLLSQVRAHTNYVRESAIFALIGHDHPKPDLFMGLVRATEERPQDLALRQTIIRAIHQHHRLRQGWTFAEEQTGLTALLISGLLDTDLVTRRKSEEVVLFAVQKKGAKHFEQYVTVTPNSPGQKSGATPVQAREPVGK